MRAAALLDRDGVLNGLVADPLSGLPESPLDPRDVVLVSGAAAGARRLAAAGLLLVGISNQPAAAKGTVSVAQLRAVQDRVVALLAAEGVRFDGFYICPHHPDFGPSCDCRKPKPGMLLEAARELRIDLTASWMLGDTDSDIAAGRAAGARTLLIEHPGSEHKRTGTPAADFTAADLANAAELLLAVQSR